MTHFEQLVYSIGWLFIAACFLIVFLVVFHKIRDAWLERRDYYDVCTKIARLRTRAQDGYPEITEACDYLLNKGDYEDKCWDAIMFIHALNKNKEARERRKKEKEFEEARMSNA